MKRYKVWIIVIVVVAAVGTVLATRSSQNLTSNLSSSTGASHPAAAVQSATLTTQPQSGMQPYVQAMQGAKKSIDLTMYELEDPNIESTLAAEAKQGVTVRVLLNKGYYGEQSSDNEAAYTYLGSHGVQVKWTPSYFALTHQKSFVIDGKTAYILTLNFTPRYYSTSRDFGITDTDPKDVSAIETAFNDDWNGTKTTAPDGDNLVWSPDARPQLVSIINSARSTLDIYNEEIGDSGINNALEAAAKRGVQVNVDMTDSSDWTTDFKQLTEAGVHVRTYAANASLYIHAKMIIADGTTAFLGSQNFSSSSLNSNRELGVIFTNRSVISTLTTTFGDDWANATPFTTSSSSGSSTTPTGVVKLSTTGICHAPGDPSYSETVHFTPYSTMQACVAAGGREAED